MIGVGLRVSEGGRPGGPEGASDCDLLLSGLWEATSPRAVPHIRLLLSLGHCRCRAYPVYAVSIGLVCWTCVQFPRIMLIQFESSA